MLRNLQERAFIALEDITDRFTVVSHRVDDYVEGRQQAELDSQHTIQASDSISEIYEAVGSQVLEEVMPIASASWQRWSDEVVEPLKSDFIDMIVNGERGAGLWYRAQTIGNLPVSSVAINLHALGYKRTFHPGEIRAAGDDTKAVQKLKADSERDDGRLVFRQTTDERGRPILKDSDGVAELAEKLGVAFVPIPPRPFGRRYSYVDLSVLDRAAQAKFEEEADQPIAGVKVDVAPRQGETPIETVEILDPTKYIPDIEHIMKKWNSDFARYGGSVSSGIQHVIKEALTNREVQALAEGRMRRSKVESMIHRAIQPELHRHLLQYRIADRLLPIVVGSPTFKALTQES